MLVGSHRHAAFRQDTFEPQGTADYLGRMRTQITRPVFHMRVRSPLYSTTEWLVCDSKLSVTRACGSMHIFMSVYGVGAFGGQRPKSVFVGCFPLYFLRQCLSHTEPGTHHFSKAGLDIFPNLSSALQTHPFTPVWRSFQLSHLPGPTLSTDPPHSSSLHPTVGRPRSGTAVLANPVKSDGKEVYAT